jgi:hypothetical protein
MMNEAIDHRKCREKIVLPSGATRQCSRVLSPDDPDQYLTCWQHRDFEDEARKIQREEKQ